MELVLVEVVLNGAPRLQRSSIAQLDVEEAA